MNHEQIESLVAVLRESPRLTEMEVRQGGKVLRLRRAPGTAGGKRIVAHAAATSSKNLVAGNGGATDVNGAAVNDNSLAATGSSAAPSAPPPLLVTAQVVGVFRWGKSGPIAPGEAVAPGQALGQIEAMRLMNEINSPASGTIEAVLVEAGQPVEYGQPLFEIIANEA